MPLDFFIKEKLKMLFKQLKSFSLIISKPISAQTLRRRLKGYGWKAVVKKKQPQLKLHYKQARLEFVEKYQNWTLKD